MIFRRMLNAKIHMATITEAELEYEGSITVDKTLMEAAGIVPHEFVLVSNTSNGERFETYIIPGEEGEICLNGATARKGLPGDRIIIFSVINVPQDEVKDLKPTIVLMGADNKPKEILKG